MIQWRLNQWSSLTLLLLLISLSCNGESKDTRLPERASMTEMDKAYMRVAYGDVLSNHIAPTRTITDSLYSYLLDMVIELEETGGQLWLVSTDHDSIFWFTPEGAGREIIQYFPYRPAPIGNSRVIGWVEQLDIYAPTDSSTIQYFSINPDTLAGGDGDE